MERQRPSDKVSVGGIVVALWPNRSGQDGQGRTTLRATISRRYRDRNGAWQTASSFGKQEMPVLLYCPQRAMDKMIAADQATVPRSQAQPASFEPANEPYRTGRGDGGDLKEQIVVEDSEIVDRPSPGRYYGDVHDRSHLQAGKPALASGQARGTEAGYRQAATDRPTHSGQDVRAGNAPARRAVEARCLPPSRSDSVAVAGIQRLLCSKSRFQAFGENHG